MNLDLFEKRSRAERLAFGNMSVSVVERTNAFEEDDVRIIFPALHVVRPNWQCL